MNLIAIEFLWIPPELGGHNGPPFSGMRLLFRQQNRLQEFLEKASDVQCELVAYDEVSGRGRAACQFLAESQDGVQIGDLVELLSGYRVVAVGKVVS